MTFDHDISYFVLLFFFLLFFRGTRKGEQWLSKVMPFCSILFQNYQLGRGLVRAGFLNELGHLPNLPLLWNRQAHTKIVQNKIQIILSKNIVDFVSSYWDFVSKNLALSAVLYYSENWYKTGYYFIVYLKRNYTFF